jgi:type II secretory pathway component PulF
VNLVVTNQELVGLSWQIGQLTQAGLPLASGLRALAEELRPGAMRDVLDDLARRTEAGMPLDQAIEAQGDRLPAHLRGLVAAGIRTGKLGQLLGEFIHYQNVGSEIRRKVTGSLLYPMVLLTFFLAIFGFCFVAIVPKFKRIYLDFGINLPPVTIMLLDASDWASEYGLWLLLGVPLVCLGLWGATRIWVGAAGARRLLLRLPFVGPLIRLVALAQFSRLLGLLLESELPLPTALRLAGSTVRDADLAEKCQVLLQDAEAGRRLADDATRRGLPASFSQAIAWGENRNCLADSLYAAAEQFESHARIHGTLVTAVLPPVLMMLCVGLTSFLVTGLFVPLIKLITELSA